MNDIDHHRSQILRQQCNRHFAGKRIPDIVGALEMLVADLVLTIPGQTEDSACAAADAIMADVRNIIRERFGALKGVH